MSLHKRKQAISAALAALVLCVFFLSCDLRGLWFGSNPEDGPPLYVLSKKDSLAIRAILNTNGLDSLGVYNVIDWYSNWRLRIKLGPGSIPKFVFSKYFDSLESGTELNAIDDNIDTLIFPDTIHNGLSINLAYNKISAIPDGIANLRGAIDLNFDNNEISSVSPNIMQCNVSVMQPFNNNKLCNIPDSISQWITKACRDSTWQTKQTCP
jgi:hypothetical protein